MKEEFKRVYDQLELSEESKQKLLQLTTGKKAVRKFKIRYAAVAAVVLGIYMTSDVVTYAATGETLTTYIYHLLSFDENGDAKLKDGSKAHTEIEDASSFAVNIYETTDEAGTEDGLQLDIKEEKS